MSDPVGRWIFVECIFVFLAVFCSLAGSAVRECSESKLARASEDGDKKAARLLPVVQEPDDFCAALRVGTVGFGFFAVSNPLTRQLVHKLAQLPPEGVWRSVAAAASWIVLVLLAIALCDFAPERYAWHRPEKAARGTFGFALLLSRLLHPIAAALLWLAGLVLRLFGVNPKAQLEEVSEDEIRLMVENGEESGAIQSGEKELIENIFEFDDITAEEIMVHRTDMTVLWLEDTGEEILKTIRESGLSRFPMCGEDMDDIIGILSTRDYLLNAQQAEPRPVQELLRPAHFVPESVKADVLFRDMQQKKVHMAIVVDEYGGTSGLVTMEDLLEQLVGEIYDEFDSEEEQEISKVGENLWRIAGSAELEDVAEALDLPLPEEDDDEYETLGGLVFSRLSVIPQDGSHPEVEALGMHIKVQEIRNHRVEWTLVSRLPQPEPEEE
ncbi:MAG: hemolysin family protein [Clostridia bacterium]|nr:hemolysin family protein [Clostridia bacterium]